MSIKNKIARSHLYNYLVILYKANTLKNNHFTTLAFLSCTILYTTY